MPSLLMRVCIPHILSLTLTLNLTLTYIPTQPASHLKARECGDSGNFRFCASFDQTDGTPFFPASYFASKVRTSDNNSATVGPALEGGGMSVGLENGDLLFLAAAGTRTVDEVSKGKGGIICVFYACTVCAYMNNQPSHPLPQTGM